MALKMFYAQKLDYQEFLQKKFFVRCLYPKHVVRFNKLEFDSLITFLDDSVLYTSLVTKSCPQIGFSFSSTLVDLIHKDNDFFRFHSFLPYRGYSSPTGECFDFNSLLKLSSNCKASKKVLFLLNPIRGGFRSYSCGILGFLPNSQFKRLFKDIFGFFKSKSEKKSKLTLKIFSFLLFQLEFFCFSCALL